MVFAQVLAAALLVFRMAQLFGLRIEDVFQAE